jgi:3-isopropylmalate/(R)-2-methylmalate dehydratase small subunit
MISVDTPGRAFVYGDNIDTDVLAPGLYMKGSVEALAEHCLEAVDAAFAATVRPGDFVVGGRNFGMGSSREQAAQVLRIKGVRAVIASSFAGIFYRNAFNLGLPALVSPDVARIRTGDRLCVDMEHGVILNHDTGETLACEKVPAHLRAIVAAGGLIGWLEARAS